MVFLRKSLFCFIRLQNIQDKHQKNKCYIAGLLLIDISLIQEELTDDTGLYKKKFSLRNF